MVKIFEKLKWLKQSTRQDKQDFLLEPMLGWR